MTNAQQIIVKTEDEMIAQLKLLLNNGYVIGIDKIDNLLGNAYYKILYAKGVNANETT